MHKPLLVASLALLLCLTPGCGNGLPPETDAAVARYALTVALDTWKAGKPVGSLKERTPPVDFRDLRWEGGAGLADYAVKGEARSGLSVRFTVELRVRQKDGSTRPTTATYTADAGKVVVIRPDF